MLGTLTYLAIPRVKKVNITHLALDDYLDLLEGSPRGKKGLNCPYLEGSGKDWKIQHNCTCLKGYCVNIGKLKCFERHFGFLRALYQTLIKAPIRNLEYKKYFQT